MERIKYTLYDYHLFNEITGEEFHLDGPINGEELHNKGPIRSSKMLNFKYLFDYPEGFTLEDLRGKIRLIFLRLAQSLQKLQRFLLWHI